jgi:hypothetical protein
MYAMMIDAKPGRPTSITASSAAWLLICAGLVFAMVVLGGVTRLTGRALHRGGTPIMG